MWNDLNGPDGDQLLEEYISCYDGDGRILHASNDEYWGITSLYQGLMYDPEPTLPGSTIACTPIT
jgi:hypothetical protein